MINSFNKKMTYVEKVDYLVERFEISKKKIAYILNMSPSKLIKAMNLEIEFDDADKVKIDRALKVWIMFSKHKAIQSEIDLQNRIINSLTQKIINKCVNLDADSQESIGNIISEMVVESMYLGMMYANRNEDEMILKKVRERRK